MKQIFFLLALNWVALGCTSKFEEKKGTSQTIQDKSAKELTLTNKTIAENALRAQEILDALGYTIDQIKLGKRQLNSSYAVLNLILEAASVSHTKKVGGDIYIAHNELMLPVSLTEDECRKILIRSEYIHTEKEVVQKIFLATCQTKFDYVELVKIVGSQDGKVSIESAANYAQILPETDAGNFLSAQGCIVKKQEEEIKEISCQAADVKINENETIVFREISYNSERDPLARMVAILYEGGESKASYLFEVFKDGKVFSKIIPREI